MSVPVTSHRAFELPKALQDGIRDEIASYRTDPSITRLRELMFGRILRYGSTCPCCTRNVQYNRKKVNRRHVNFAAAMLDKHGARPFKISTELTKRYLGAPFTLSGVEMLSYVGLIETGDDIFIDYLCDDWPCKGTTEEPCKSARKVGYHRRKSGVWRCTEKLVQFLDGDVSVPREVFFFGGRPYAVSVEQVSIGDLPVSASSFSAGSDEDEDEDED